MCIRDRVSTRWFNSSNTSTSVRSNNIVDCIWISIITSSTFHCRQVRIGIITIYISTKTIAICIIRRNNDYVCSCTAITICNSYCISTWLRNGNSSIRTSCRPLVSYCTSNCSCIYSYFLKTCKPFCTASKCTTCPTS